MREIRQIGEQKIKTNGKHILTEDVLNVLGSFLNSREGQHIDYVYFDKNNDFYYNVHAYIGREKKWRGKKFVRFQSSPRQVAPGHYVNEYVPNEDYEIIKEYEASELIDLYEKLLKKQGRV